MTYPDRQALQIQGGAEELWGDHCYVYHSAVSPASILLAYRSPGTDLLQVMTVDDSELTFIGGHWALALVPYVLLAAGLLLIAALWLYRQIYLPLRRVMGSLEAGRGRNQVDALRQPGGSELDLVQSMVEDDRRQREAMQTMLTQVQESVREKLLLSLFRDGLPETQLAQLSESGQLPPRVGTYAVICLEWHRTADGSQQDEDVLCGCAYPWPLKPPVGSWVQFGEYR